MEMGSVGHLTTVANYRDDFTCVNKCTNFFQEFRIVFVYRNEVPAMLNRDHVPRILRPWCEDHGAVGDGLDGLVGARHYIHTIMAILDFITVGDEPCYGREEKCSHELARGTFGIVDEGKPRLLEFLSER